MLCALGLGVSSVSATARASQMRSQQLAAAYKAQQAATESVLLGRDQISEYDSMSCSPWLSFVSVYLMQRNFSGHMSYLFADGEMSTTTIFFKRQKNSKSSTNFKRRKCNTESKMGRCGILCVCARE
jgi:hypothetical protein